MTSVHKPKGLIRYASQDELEGHSSGLLRTRVVLYSIALTVVLSTLGVTLSTRKAAEITLLRSSSEPYHVEADGRVANQLRVKIVNRSNSPQTYQIRIEGMATGTVIAPEFPLTVTAGGQRTSSLFLLDRYESFTGGRHDVTVHLEDGSGFTTDMPFTLLGPVRRQNVPAAPVAPPSAPQQPSRP